MFRPVFRCAAAEKEGGNNLWIIAYREVAPADTPALLSSIRPHDLSDPADRLVRPLDMVYNVPLVIGAKKGLPSFDEFTMDTQIQMARKLIYHRASTNTIAPVNEIDVAYLPCRYKRPGPASVELVRHFLHEPGHNAGLARRQRRLHQPRDRRIAQPGGLSLASCRPTLLRL